MNAAVKTILTTVVAAAIIGNVTMLFQFSTRLARIETKLEMLADHQTFVQK